MLRDYSLIHRNVSNALLSLLDKEKLKMNGLKFIRSFCYMSTNALAEKLGVSRSAVTLWENGQKEIPEKRAEEIAEIFGVDKELIYEISDEKVEEMKEGALRYQIKGETFYRLSPNESTKEIPFGILDMEEMDSFHREAEYKKELGEFIEKMKKHFVLEDEPYSKMIDLEIKLSRLKYMEQLLEIFKKTDPAAGAQNYTVKMAMSALGKLFDVEYEAPDKKVDAKAELIADEMLESSKEIVSRRIKSLRGDGIKATNEEEKERKLKEMIAEDIGKLSTRYKSKTE